MDEFPDSNSSSVDFDPGDVISFTHSNDILLHNQPEGQQENCN